MGIVGVSAIYISNVSLVNSFKTLTYKVDVLEEFYLSKNYERKTELIMKYLVKSPK